MKISEKRLIEQKVMNNLLYALEQAAEWGRASEVILLIRVLLRLAKKRDGVLVDLLPEGDQNRDCEPVQ